MTKNQISTDVLTTMNDLKQVEDEWTALADVSGSTQFSLPAYSLPWWKTHGNGELRVVAARKNGRLVGLLPVYQRDYRIGRAEIAHLLRWLGHGYGTVASMLIAPDVDEDKVGDAIWDTLAEASPDRVALQLIEYRVGGLGMRSLRRSKAWDPFLELRSVVPVVQIDELPKLLAGSAKRRLRHTLSTAERNLESGGHQLCMRTMTTVDEFRTHLPDIDYLFDEAERHAPKLHMFDGSLRSMSLEAIETSLESKHTVLHMAWVDERPIALDVTIVVNNCVYGYIRRHHPDARDFSPGHLMMRQNITHALEHNIAVLDLGLGDDEYKRRWANHWYDAAVVTGGRTGHQGVGRLAVRGVDAVHSARSRFLPSFSR